MILSIGNIGSEYKDLTNKLANSNEVKSIISRISSQYGYNIPLYYGGIYNKLTDTMIPFLVPESVNRSHSNTLEEVSIETRSVGMPYFTGGGSPTVSFDILLNDDFYSLMVQKGLLGVSNPTQYIKKAFELYNGSSINEVISALRALTYPEYDRGVAKPPEVLIYLGESSCYRAICTSVSDTLQGLTGMNRSLQFTYRECNVSLSFTILKEVTTTNKSNVPSASDIQKGNAGVFS